MNEDLYQAIAAHYDFTEEKIMDAVQLAGGNYNKAVQYLNTSSEADYLFDMFIRLMRLVYSVNLKDLLSWVDEIASAGREKQKSFLLASIRLIRENFLVHINKPELVKMTSEERTFSEKFSTFISEKNVAGIADELNLACNHIEANGYARIVFLDLSLKLSRLIRSY